MRYNADKTLMVAAGVLALIWLFAAFNTGTGDRSRPGADALPPGVNADGVVNVADTNSAEVNRSRGNATVGSNSDSGAPPTNRFVTPSAQAREWLKDATWPPYPPVVQTRYDREKRERGNRACGGTVHSAEGQPLGGVRVMVRVGEGSHGPLTVPVPRDSAGETCEAAAVSSADGRFRIGELSEQPHHVWTSAPFFLPVKLDVAVPTDSLELQLDQFGRIVGTVSRADGSPETDFTVLLAWAGPLPGPGANQAPVKPDMPARYFEPGVPMWVDDPTQPNPDVFRYSFSGVTNGRFACYTGIGQFYVWVFSKGSSVAARPVVSPLNSVVPLSFTLTRPTSIEGRVVAADDPETPVVNAIVDARFVQPAKTAGSVRTDSDGRFRIDLPHAGEVRLIVKHHQYLPYEHLVHVADGEKKPVTCEIRTGAVLTGKVTDADGKGLAGMSVRVTPREEAGSMLRAGNATTDESGEFRVPGLTPGRHLASVDSSGPYVGTQKLVDVTDAKTECTLVVETGITCVFSVARAETSHSLIV